MQQLPRQESGKNIPMINSFLSLCRVCPVLTDDKVNSEYKRNFTWHDRYQAPKIDVIKNAPSLPQFNVEPSLPRKKKYPEYAHRTHELLFDYEDGECSDSQTIFAWSRGELDARARSGSRNAEKNRGSPRSKSADSSISRRLRTTTISDEEKKPSVKGPKDVKTEDESKAGKSREKPSSHLPAAGAKSNPSTADLEGMPKTTEYRSQFVAWTQRLQQEELGVPTSARKSASMGVIASQAMKKDVVDGETSGAEVQGGKSDETVDDEAALDAVKRGRIKKTEYKSKFRPFSAYTYVDGSWKKATRLIKDGPEDDMTIYTSFSFPSFVDVQFSESDAPSDGDSHIWYAEVVERLKKADQYRLRSHGGMPFYGSSDQPVPSELLAKERSILSPVSLSSTARTWKDDRPMKERSRPTAVPVHHSRKEKKEHEEGVEEPKGSPKKKPAVEKTTARPKSAEPVVPIGKGENRSPKRTRPRAPKDLPVHGHGDLSGRKKAHKQGVSSPHGKGSPMDNKPRVVSRPHGTGAVVVNGDDGKVWLKPSSKEQAGDKEPKNEETAINCYPDRDIPNKDLVNGESEEPDSVQDSKMNGHMEEIFQAAIMKPPMKVPLTTVKSPEEVTGVRSPDPESWTVPLEIGKGLQWMDGKTPDGAPTKTPSIIAKRLKESSLIGAGRKEFFVCDPGSASGGDSVDL